MVCFEIINILFIGIRRNLTIHIVFGLKLIVIKFNRLKLSIAKSTMLLISKCCFRSLIFHI